MLGLTSRLDLVKLGYATLDKAMLGDSVCIRLD